ncbi:PPR containing protein [Rhynchospora pubera]|uniref:PPR containing protein n=1 Tax=Rhynchospora pubera TaxID=906938 RepID=A0AAV8GSI7_9POAL|nr:PPR containing protein [Rhynchospora pubera]
MAMGMSKRGQGKVKGRGRLLVTVTVYGSAGPLRFLVNEGEMASGVVRLALKTYAREGRLPLLGTHLDEFLLYHANGGFDALDPGYVIHFNGARNFLLCKKQIEEVIEEKVEEKAIAGSVIASKKGYSSSWKSGLNKSLNKILSFRI